MFLEESKYLIETKESFEKGIKLPKTIHGKTLKDYFKLNSEFPFETTKTITTSSQTEYQLADTSSSSNYFWNTKEACCSMCLNGDHYDYPLNDCQNEIKEENILYDRGLLENDYCSNPMYIIPPEVEASMNSDDSGSNIVHSCERQKSKISNYQDT